MTDSIESLERRVTEATDALGAHLDALKAEGYSVVSIEYGSPAWRLIVAYRDAKNALEAARKPQKLTATEACRIYYEQNGCNATPSAIRDMQRVLDAERERTCKVIERDLKKHPTGIAIGDAIDIIRRSLTGAQS